MKAKKEWADIGHHLRYCRVCLCKSGIGFMLCDNGIALEQAYFRKRPDLTKEIEVHGHMLAKKLESIISATPAT
jgi:hypothetical protein